MIKKKVQAKKVDKNLIIADTIISERENIHNKSFPISINIKNLTDEKIYDVKLFDFDHNKQSKIKYTGSPSEYDSLLRELVANRCATTNNYINGMKVIASCDYKKFEAKQIVCGYKLRETEVSGREKNKSESLANTMSPFQYLQNINQVNDISLLFHLSSNIIFEYLMPETEIKIIIFIGDKKA